MGLLNKPHSRSKVKSEMNVYQEDKYLTFYENAPYQELPPIREMRRTINI